MATTTSIVGTVNALAFNNLKTDDGNTARIRDGQEAICSNFSSLSIPAGATINGIEVDMEGYASATTQAEDSFSVSNDDGTTFSTEQNITTGPWSTDSETHLVETAGGTSELWGMTWNATTAAAIQFKIDFTVNSGAVYFNYVNMHIHYEEEITTYTSDDNIILKNGLLTLKDGITEIK